jgi:hypothetical protein
MKISVLFLALLRIELSDIIKLLMLVSSFFFLTLVASSSAAAENLNLELRKRSDIIKLLILVSCLFLLISYHCGLARNRTWIWSFGNSYTIHCTTRP